MPPLRATWVPAAHPHSGLPSWPGSARRDASDLLEHYSAHRDQRSRETLVRRFLPLAYDVARRYHRLGEPLDDLIQVACLGLVKAIDRFDPKRGVAFSTYAVPTMVGELKRHFRDTAWAVHLPRSLSEHWLAVERAQRELRATLRRAPTVAEVSERTELPTNQVLAAMEAGKARGTLSLDCPRGAHGEGSEWRDGDPRLEAIGATDEHLERVHDAVTVAGVVRELSPLEREVLRLRFLHELTQSEIAVRTGVSQMQVSRIIRRSLEHLNRRVAPAAEYS
jgi:RNA polymerase sigma-B factor